jgi:hypothetical protein
MVITTYAATIGRILEDNITQATLLSDSDIQPTVQINSNPVFLMLEQWLNESCLRMPLGMPANCAISSSGGRVPLS